MPAIPRSESNLIINLSPFKDLPGGRKYCDASALGVDERVARALIHNNGTGCDSSKNGTGVTWNILIVADELSTAGVGPPRSSLFRIVDTPVLAAQSVHLGRPKTLEYYG
jgi:hypothetical protein